MLLRIAVQAKGRLYDETMSFLGESDIKLNAVKRSLLVQSSNFPVEVLFLRDDDIPQSVATGVADIGIVGENEYVEKNENAEIVKRLGFSKCRLSLAIPKDIEYPGVQWFEGRKIATSYPGILSTFLKTQNVNAEIHVITGSVEVAPGIGLADAIFDIVSSGSTLVSNRLREVEVVMKSEALLIGNRNLCDEKKEILKELLFRMDAVKTAEDKKYVLMNAPKLPDLFFQLSSGKIRGLQIIICKSFHTQKLFPFIGNGIVQTSAEAFVQRMLPACLFITLDDNLILCLNIEDLHIQIRLTFQFQQHTISICKHITGAQIGSNSKLPEMILRLPADLHKFPHELRRQIINTIIADVL